MIQRDMGKSELLFHLRECRKGKVGHIRRAWELWEACDTEKSGSDAVWSAIECGDW